MLTPLGAAAGPFICFCIDFLFCQHSVWGTQTLALFWTATQKLREPVGFDLFSFSALWDDNITDNPSWPKKYQTVGWFCMFFGMIAIASKPLWRVSQDLEAASIEAQNRIAASSCKRQRPWRNSRGDFSNILLPEPKVEALCMPLRLVQWLMFATGVLAAIIVTLLFGILLRSIDMRCTVISGRHSAGCPGNSCFCTDCDPCNMYLAERDWEWKHFGCSILGLPLNRCWLAFSLNLWWLGATSRLGWLTLRACQRDRGQLVPVVIACSLSATSAISLWQTFLSQSAKLIVNSLKYNVINTCLLASSMSIVLRLSSLQPEQPCCGRAFDMLSRQFLRSFWPTAVLGELCVMLLTRSTESFEEFIEQENKFYLLYLMLGLLFSWVAWRLALGISSKYSSNQGFKLKGVVWQLLIVKTVWCTCRCLHWLLTCHNLGTLTNKYNLAMVLIERLAVLEILRLIKHFSTLYAQLKQVPFLVDIRPLDE